jgi:hypothetical protein
MSKQQKQDGIVYSGNDGKILWIRYRDRTGNAAENPPEPRTDSKPTASFGNGCKPETAIF